MLDFYSSQTNHLNHLSVDLVHWGLKSVLAHILVPFVQLSCRGFVRILGDLSHLILTRQLG